MKLILMEILTFTVFSLCCKASGILTNRVVGGFNTPEGLLPYQVSIQNTVQGHFCGGTIIAPEWILTAAHCLKYPKQYMKIVTGTIYWRQPNAVYSVADIKIHCQFNNLQLQNDIALIRLSRPIVYNERTQPLRLAWRNTLNQGDPLRLSGWGYLQVGGFTPDILQQVILRYVPQAPCRNNVKYPARLGEGHICTYAIPGRGACFGDSGGPLVDVVNNVLVGVVSWGEPCAIGNPDVFTSVAYYYNWIRGIVAGSNTCYRLF